MAISERRSPSSNSAPFPDQRAEQDADEQGGTEHSARESEPYAERGRQDLGDEEKRELTGGERMVDDCEAQRLLADAEDVGQPDRGQPQDGSRQHRLDVVRDGQPAGDSVREEDRPHVEHGDEGAADTDEDEPQELGRGAYGDGFHPEQRGPLEDDVGNDVAHRRGDGDRREGAQGVVPEDDFVREDDARNRGVERGRYRGRDAAAHPDRRHPPAVAADAGDEGAKRRPEVRERPVLADGCTGPE